jgi:hypothetical protein
VFRSEFLLFARFAHLLPAGLVETRLKERIACIDKELETLTDIAKEQGQACDAWVISHGRACLGVAREHIQTHMHELIAMAQPDTTGAKAAE